ncbi:hypothetical protein ACF07U_28365 [Streptomyces californicus]|uniref:hypothetical protein n=1 Tax=Streptomyces californicus TaxID=67351 RepID=UPI0036FB0D12
MTENRPAITADQFAELCRIVQTISDERTLTYYLDNKGENGRPENGPKKYHREWVLHILGQIGVSIQPGEDTGEFLKAMGIGPTYP